MRRHAHRRLGGPQFIAAAVVVVSSRSCRMEFAILFLISRRDAEPLRLFGRACRPALRREGLVHGLINHEDHVEHVVVS